MIFPFYSSLLKLAIRDHPIEDVPAYNAVNKKGRPVS